MPWTTALIGAIGILLLGAVVYWQLIIAEGAYLGQPLVTWLYDLTASRYDRIKQFDRDFESRYLGRPLSDELRAVHAPLLLDIATGSGRLPLTLFDQPSFQGRVVGLDASRPMLHQAARNLHGYRQVDLIWRDAIDLPFPDGCFDAVTMLEMVEFTPNPVSQLREAIRVLRPGGLLLTTRRRGMDAALMPGKTMGKDTFEALLASLGLARVSIEPWQVDYDLVWAWRGGQGVRGARPLLEYLLCPSCRNPGLVERSAEIICEACQRRYRIASGIIELHN
jgi:ubiquinone/menaquinone biosynthesis C-methylase UbiE